MSLLLKMNSRSPATTRSAPKPSAGKTMCPAAAGGDGAELQVPLLEHEADRPLLPPQRPAQEAQGGLMNAVEYPSGKTSGDFVREHSYVNDSDLDRDALRRRNHAILLAARVVPGRGRRDPEPQPSKEDLRRPGCMAESHLRVTVGVVGEKFPGGPARRNRMVGFGLRSVGYHGRVRRADRPRRSGRQPRPSGHNHARPDGEHEGVRTAPPVAIVPTIVLDTLGRGWLHRDRCLPSDQAPDEPKMRAWLGRSRSFSEAGVNSVPVRSGCFGPSSSTACVRISSWALRSVR
jgi:hypothetical protein